MRQKEDEVRKRLPEERQTLLARRGPPKEPAPYSLEGIAHAPNSFSAPVSACA